jgi:hypothetical protein
VLTQRPFPCRVVRKIGLARSSAGYELLANAIKKAVADNRDSVADIVRGIARLDSIATGAGDPGTNTEPCVAAVEYVVSLVAGAVGQQCAATPARLRTYIWGV